MHAIGTTIVDLIGHTPLLPLRRLDPALPSSIQIFIKAEWTNPGGSVKDRAACAIVQNALARGLLRPGMRLLDASSGNTGIAYAMLGAALGFGVTLCLPANANPERQKTLAIYGAEIIRTDPTESTDGAIVEARKLAQSAPERYYYADQYANPCNWQAHVRTTGPELLAQTQGQLTHFVVGLGTTGTCVGVGRFLRERLPQAQVVAVQPSGPFHGLEGLKHLESAMVPPIYDAAVPHQQAQSNTEHAYAMAKRLAREEGFLVGISTGAAVRVAVDIAHRLAAAHQPGCIVALAPDGGSRYLSEHFWQE